MGRSAGNRHLQSQNSLCGNADVEIGRLARDRELAGEAPVDQEVAPPVLGFLRLLVTDYADPGQDPRGGLAGSRKCHEHCGQRGLHVVGAPAEQPVPLDPRLELVGIAGNDIEVAVEDQDPALGIPCLGGQHREAPALLLMHRNAPGIEPSLDEARGLMHPLGLRGVVGDQAPGQGQQVGDR